MRVRRFVYLFITLFLFAWSPPSAAQEPWVVTGCVTDLKSGEALEEVFVQAMAGATRVAHTFTKKNGVYTLTLPFRDVVLEFHSLGYKKEQITLKYAQRKKQVDVGLVESTVNLAQVVVKGEKEDFAIRRPDMGLERITPQHVKKIPLFLGEADIIKVIQSLPGVQAASEGSSGYIVRGGSPDQNLVLFDRTTVYNPSHMMGFFSVFNIDAVEDVQLYKGDIPAGYGGRLSSLLDVKGREGNSEYDVTGGIGLIASRLAVSGPLGKKITWLAAARRTYADLFLRLSRDTTVNDAIIHFYDLNGKMRWRVNENNHVTLTLYNGNDRFGTHGVVFNFGNSIGALAWNHRFSPRFSLVTSLSGTMYQYEFKAIMSSLESRWIANIKEAGLRTDFHYKWNKQTDIRFGWNSTYQWFRPGNANIAFKSDINSYELPIDLPRRQAVLNTLYFSNEHTIFDQRLQLRYGLRLTRFDNVGPTTQYLLDDAYSVSDSILVRAGHFYHHEYGLEPRFALSYMLNGRMSVKASYSRMLQYVHLLSFSSSGSPLDMWIPANPAIRPQSAHQFAVGYFGKFLNNRLQASVELFYKNLNHVVDFKDHPNVLLYDKVETELRFGSGYAYGTELMFKKEEGDITGWISYTWLRSFRKIIGVNNNMRYPAPSDRPHNVSVVLNYPLPFSKRIEFSLNWIYATGQPFIMPEGRYNFFKEFIPVYSARNAFRMPDYHRMDASLILRLHRSGSKFMNDLNLSVYNVYGRKNPWMINYRLRLQGTQYAEMTYLFGVVPSITWNFSF